MPPQHEALCFISLQSLGHHLAGLVKGTSGICKYIFIRGVHWWLLLWSLAGGLSGTQGTVFMVLMVTSPLVLRVSLALVGMLVTPPLVIRLSLAIGLLVSDSSCVHGESSLHLLQVHLPLIPLHHHSLETGRGMDRRFKVLTCSLPCRWLKAVSCIHVMGSLGHSVYVAVDAADHVLSGVLGLLSDTDTVVESYCEV